MKRVLGILAGAGLAMLIGCAQSYDLRIEETLKTMRYRRDLDKNTEAPPAKSNLETAKIYLRSPKGLKGPAKAFPFVVEPGKFDVTDSFIDTDKQNSLHLLARTNAPKPGVTKKAAAPPAEGGEAAPPPAARGEFTSDVIDFIKSAYNTDFEASVFKPIEPNSHGRKGVPYKGATIDLGNKVIKVYFHGDKNGPAQVALIFEGTKESLRALSSQIDYSLNSLVLGPKATGFYNGQDELAADEGIAAPPGGVFERDQHRPAERHKVAGRSDRRSSQGAIEGRRVDPAHPAERPAAGSVAHKKTEPLPPGSSQGGEVRFLYVSFPVSINRSRGAEHLGKQMWADSWEVVARGEAKDRSIRSINARPRPGR